MSYLTEELCKQLGHFGNSSVIEAIETLARLSKDSKRTISEYLQQHEEADVTELHVVSASQESGIAMDFSAKVYSEVPNLIGFARSLRGKNPILVKEENGVQVYIQNPETDIHLDRVLRGGEGPPQPEFIIRMIAVGFGTQAHLSTRQVIHDTDHESMLEHIIMVCRQDLLHSLTTMTGFAGVIKKWVTDPRDVDLVNYAKLFDVFTRQQGGNMRHLKSQSLNFVSIIINTLIETYTVRAKVDVKIILQLQEMSELFKFVAAPHFLLMENPIEKQDDIILVKEGDCWMRAAKSHKMYKEALLFKKLQQ